MHDLGQYSGGVIGWTEDRVYALDDDSHITVRRAEPPFAEVHGAPTPDPVQSVALSGDGRYLAWLGLDDMVHRYDFVPDRTDLSFAATKDSYIAGVSADGVLVASRSGISLRDAAGGVAVPVRGDLDGWASDVAGDLVVVNDALDRSSLYDVSDGTARPTETFPGSAALGPHAERVAVIVPEGARPRPGRGLGRRDARAGHRPRRRRPDGRPLGRRDHAVGHWRQWPLRLSTSTCTAGGCPWTGCPTSASESAALDAVDDDLSVLGRDGATEDHGVRDLLLVEVPGVLVARGLLLRLEDVDDDRLGLGGQVDGGDPALDQADRPGQPLLVRAGEDGLRLRHAGVVGGRLGVAAGLRLVVAAAGQGQGQQQCRRQGPPQVAWRKLGGTGTSRARSAEVLG